MTTLAACPTCATRNRVPGASRGTPRCGRCRAPLPWIVDADDASFPEVAQASPVPVLVDLWAPWCGPCRTVGPVLERLAGEFAGRLKLVKVNVDQAQATGARLGAKAIPTLVAMEGGRELARQVGAAPADRLRSWLRTVLEQAPRAQS